MQISLIEVGEFELVPDPLAQPKTLWLVAAYDSIGRYWSVRPEHWTDEDAARKLAVGLHARWKHRRILKVVLEP